MQMNRLGRNGPTVSAICLGSMTWGTQNTAPEAHAQIERARDAGVNFIDTAEMYPTTPLTAERTGATEAILGEWLGQPGKRESMIVATKVSGAGSEATRPGGPPIAPAIIREAIEGSLRRLRTDYVDLYQLHWPNRGSYHFRQNWGYDPSRQETGRADEFRAILETLGALVTEGKIRHFGLSNETAWGMAQWLGLAEAHGLPRAVSIQNEYSLLHRIFDLDLAELCHHEDVGLLAYSPLACGLLTGKYAGGAVPEGARADVASPDLGGRIHARSAPAVERYMALAREHGLDPAQMALAFCLARPFMASVIIGATTQQQLETDLGAVDVSLSPEVQEGIAEIYRDHPIPL